ncbi:MAG: cobaltochelatase subunit CobN [Methanothrix sp.]|uniref:cobaltochelatase subunit CobN n=1 Tax=Methanothrix sp. TaxID=90426 RepID=UPI0025CBF4F1|nr:cobaltochelatase subunit CobN [Methanothrix sp.]MCQ8904018.1 cobaltochelatase subunit CobN [Methanothrix sp.]
MSLLMQANADFLTFHGDNQRTGNISGIGPDSPDLLWSTSLTGHGYIGGSAVVYSDRIFVSNWPDMTFKGELGLACIDARNGTVLWINPIGGKGGASTPAVFGERVFVGSLTGEIYCVDGVTGRTLWNRTVERNPEYWGVASSPLVENNTIYIMSFSDGTLHALSLGGEELWNISTGRVSPFSSPASSKQMMYFPGGDPALYCVNLSSHQIVWKAPVDGAITAGPALWNDIAFVVTDRAILALNASTGQITWQREINGTTSTPSIAFNRVYVGTDDRPRGRMICLDTNGSLLWEREVNGPVRSSPIFLDGRIYFGTNTDEGTVYALNASDGSVVWTYPVKQYIMSSPSASDGALFIGSDDGRLYAFGSKPEKLLWKGEVLLENRSTNVTAISGEIYTVDMRSALGALIAFASSNNINISVNDSLLDLYGLRIESIGDLVSSKNRSWRYWINYPDEPVPLVGPESVILNDGDTVVFYYGERNARPEDCHRLEITARLQRPDALFATVGQQPALREAMKGAPLNITLVSPDALDTEVNLSGYSLIFLEMIGADAAAGLQPLLEEPRRRGVPVIILNSPGYQNLANVNLSAHPDIEMYWEYGGVENMRRLIAYLASHFCGIDVKTEAPLPTPKEYIYHPDAPDLFENVSSYLEWYHRNASAPTVGIASYYGDMGQTDRDDLIRAFEKRGANVICIGFSNASSLERFFVLNNTTLIDVAVLTKSFRLSYGDPDRGVEILESLNVPVLRGMRLYYQSPQEWPNSSINPMELYFQVALPEMDGVFDPIAVSGKNESVYSSIEPEVERIADRALAQVRLKKPNSEKRVAIIYYNHGGGKDNIEGCYLNVPRSLRNILDHMKGLGYRIEGDVPDEKILVDLLAHQGTNIGTWAPGELDAMVARGNATLIPAEEYIHWFKELPVERQNEVIEHWGPPPGEIMVFRNSSGSYIVIPKLSFGNVMLLPQPTRGWLENNTVLYHSTDVPPHHQYIAFYLWLKHGFGADAIIHLGKHGTQEWLPGREGVVGGDDWPALLVQDIPVVYPYIVDNIAEGTQAKRRGDAVMVSHLTPPIVAAGLYGNLSDLAKSIYEYRNVLNESVKEEYRKRIAETCRDLHLDEDLGVNLTGLSEPEAFDGFLPELERYLEEVKSSFMPYGLHTFGQPYENDSLVSMIESMLGDRYKEEISREFSIANYTISGGIENVSRALLYDVLINGTSPMAAQEALLGGVKSNLTEMLNTSLVYADGLRRCNNELSNTTNALSKGYIPPSPADDPIRDPQVLPTGRNFRSVDPRRVPTSAAWEVGRKLAEELLEEYRLKHNGTYPRKMAVVLWAWAMTDHGVVDSEILQLVGARPVYDAYGGVSDVELIPLSELGRPRIDVVVVPSGLYRDLFPEKLKLIDRAIRLAANDTDTTYPNYVRENSELLKNMFLETGNYSAEDAEFLSRSRIFLEAAGTYGPNLDAPISASDRWENDSELGDLFISRMSYIYGDGIWGGSFDSGRSLSTEEQMEVFRANLKDVDLAVHHTNSNLYGFIDNDDVFQYLGGIALAVRTVTGTTPEMYVTDGRDPRRERVHELGEFFSRELRTRYYNPRWIQGMMEQGYSGAREMDKFVEYLWGWETTVPDLVSESTWSEVHDIYVEDKYGLGLKEFFRENNPWAAQAIDARLLETARKDRWQPTPEMAKNLVEQYRDLVEDYGVACCHHTCGNLLLNEYMSGVLPARVEKTSSSSARSKSSSSSHSRPHRLAENSTLPEGVGADVTKTPESKTADVKGYVMENVTVNTQIPSVSGAPLFGIALVLLLLLLVAAGLWRR